MAQRFNTVLFLILLPGTHSPLSKTDSWFPIFNFIGPISKPTSYDAFSGPSSLSFTGNSVFLGKGFLGKYLLQNKGISHIQNANDLVPKAKQS